MFISVVCFFMVTAPPEPTGETNQGERHIERERYIYIQRERGTEMMEDKGRWLAV